MIAAALLFATALAQTPPTDVSHPQAVPPITLAPSLTCGAVSAPGLAQLGADGVWRGYLVSLCRRIASVTGRDPKNIAFHSYDGPDGLAHAADDDVAFLSPMEMASGTLSDDLLDGPVVSHDRQLLVQRADVPAQSLPSLAGKLICFIAGTRAEDALNRWAEHSKIAVEYLPFQEPVEMADAFAVGKCAAEAIDIANISSPRDVRVLATLESLPILVATPAERGQDWRQQVADAIAGNANPPDNPDQTD